MFLREFKVSRADVQDPHIPILKVKCLARHRANEFSFELIAFVVKLVEVEVNKLPCCSGCAIRPNRVLNFNVKTTTDLMPAKAENPEIMEITRQRNGGIN